MPWLGLFQSCSFWNGTCFEVCESVRLRVIPPVSRGIIQPLFFLGMYESVFPGVGSPFFSTIVLFQNQAFSLGFWRFSRKKINPLEYRRLCVSALSLLGSVHLFVARKRTKGCMPFCIHAFLEEEVMGCLRVRPLLSGQTIAVLGVQQRGQRGIPPLFLLSNHWKKGDPQKE